MGQRRSLPLITWKTGVTSSLGELNHERRMGSSSWTTSSARPPTPFCSNDPRVENSSGGGFDLLWAGPNATNVPKEAIITDGATPGITTNQDSLWSYYQPVECYGQTLSYTDTFGASLHYTFNGVAIWYDCVSRAIQRPTISCRYYGGVGPSSASFTVSIDGSTPQRVERERTSRVVEQQMLWSNTSLDPGGHTSH